MYFYDVFLLVMIIAIAGGPKWRDLICLLLPLAYNGGLALFGPDFLNPPPVAACLVSVALCALISLCGEAFVHINFDIVAASNSFVQKTLGVTFVKSIHDLFAV